MCGSMGYAIGGALDITRGGKLAGGELEFIALDVGGGHMAVGWDGSKVKTKSNKQSVLGGQIQY